ncbi:MAG: lipocalin family protein [Xanthomarina sp.]
MKKQFNILKVIFSIALGLILFTGCSSDDDNSPANQGPKSFNLIQVADGSLNVEINPTFSWSAAASPDGSPVTYDLYLDTNNPPTTKVASNLTNTIYTLQNNLEYGEVYNWKVVAKNDQGSTSSHVASFKTRPATTIDFLIGKWFLDSAQIPGEPNPIIFTECEKTSFFHFSVGGIMLQVMFDLNANEDCLTTTAVQSSYEVINESTLRITNSNGDFWQIPINSINENTLVLMEGTASITFKKEQ